MITVEQIIEYTEQLIAEKRLAGDQHALRTIQYAAGLLMTAAEQAGDRETARRFRVLAAEAADTQAQPGGEA